MLDLRLYLVQRLSALVMIPFVFTHLIVMIYAIQDGLTAGEILGRTQGSIGWALFYGTFVIAAATHGSVGLRVILHEWAGMRGRVLTLSAWAMFLGLSAMGLMAVWAVTAGGGA
ncbi:MAG: succinate dehydrogenase [Pseudomonadota bacterium]